jgi:hypothetical protein
MIFKETKTMVDDEFSSWSGYRDNSAGRLIHYVYYYLGFHYAEGCQVSNQDVKFWGRTIAFVDWTTGFPIFTFTDTLDDSLKEYAIQKQNNVLKNQGNKTNE